MPDAKPTIAYSDLLTFAANLLAAGGFSADHARQTADMLVWANLRGVDSHGVLRIPRYLEMVQLGLINPAASPQTVLHKGAVSVIDADRAPGAVAMNLAAQTAAKLSGDHGIGWCAVRGITHAGAIGYYAQQVSQLGRIGIVMTASKPLMVYYGSKAEGVSTNPIAIAAPTGDPDRPLLFDMSTAAVALGKIMAARDAGKAIPLDWGVDKDGVQTSDPAKVKAVLPLGGAKGSGLSLMIEVLASVLVGNPLISIALSGHSDPGGNGVVIALDPSAFGAADTFATMADELCTAIKGLPPAQGVTSVLLPGERGADEMTRRLQAGVPIAGGTLSRLEQLAVQLKVPVPSSTSQ